MMNKIIIYKKDGHHIVDMKVNSLFVTEIPARKRLLYGAIKQLERSIEKFAKEMRTCRR